MCPGASKRVICNEYNVYIRNELSTDREPLIPFQDACRLKWLPLRRKGSQLSVRTLTRWHVDGQHVGGRAICLRAVKVGNTLCTRESWLEEHFAAVDEAGRTPAPNATPGPAPKARAKQEAAAILDAAGI